MKIRAIIKRPDEEVGHATWIVDRLENLQKHVGGYIETVTCADGTVILCDEEGRFKDYDHNCFVDTGHGWVVFVGTIVVLGTEGEEFASCALSLKEFRERIRR